MVTILIQCCTSIVLSVWLFTKRYTKTITIPKVLQDKSYQKNICLHKYNLQRQIFLHIIQDISFPFRYIRFHNTPGGNRTHNCPLGGGCYIHLTTDAYFHSLYYYIIHYFKSQSLIFVILYFICLILISQSFSCICDSIFYLLNPNISIIFLHL